MKDDFGYFGTGDEGYAQYMTAFGRNFGSSDADNDLPEEDSFEDCDGSEEDF